MEEAGEIGGAHAWLALLFIGVCIAQWLAVVAIEAGVKWVWRKAIHKDLG